MKEAICIFKPDAITRSVEIYGTSYTIAEYGHTLLIAAGLQIVETTTPQLSYEDVYKIYENVLKPNPQDDAIWGTDWKQEVMEHLTSRPVEALLLCDSFDDEALEKTQNVKRYLRSKYVVGNEVVRNLAHVPDEHEISFTRGILFSSKEVSVE